MDLSQPEWIVTGAGDPLPPPPTPEEIQPLFPHLEIVRLIGRGGMGAVYEARQRGLHRTVALKILWAPPIPDAGFEGRFSREGRALASLAHDNVVAVHDAGKSGPYYWLVMEYVDGPNLRQVLQSGAIEPARALVIVMQMCAALDYAHQQGVVHRDIKPENVLITRSGRIKIADFGLAKMMAREPSGMALTGTLQAMGTPHYMAPEQIERPKDVDHRADIYSLGVVFYEVLTGELPLGRFQMPSRKVRLDARLDDIVAKTLQKEPERRYQAAAEVSTAVDFVANARARARVTTVRPRAKKQGPWALVAAGIAVVLAAWLVVPRLKVLGASAPLAEMTAKQAWDEGNAALLANPNALLRPIACFERVVATDPAFPGIREKLETLMPKGINELINAEKPFHALEMAQRFDGYVPSEANHAFLRQTRERAVTELARRVVITAPNERATLDSNEVRLVGTIVKTSVDDFPIQKLSVAGQEVRPIGAGFDHPLSGLPEGPQKIELKVELACGLTLDLVRNVVVDTQPPVLEVTSPTNKGFVSGNFTVEGTVSDHSPTTVRCGDQLKTLDHCGRWSFDVAESEGSHQVEIDATDKFGRAAKQVTIAVMVDTTAPVIDLGREPEMVSRLETETIQVRVTGETELKAILLDDRPVGGGSTIQLGSDGLVPVVIAFGKAESAPVPHSLVVVDLADNRSTPIEFTTRLDQTKPRIEYDQNEPRALSGKPYALKVSFDDPSACELVEGSGTPHQPSAKGQFDVLIDIPSGLGVTETHYLEFDVRDCAGNKTSARLPVRISEACAECKGDKHCTDCEGTGDIRKSCAGCNKGSIKRRCEACTGHGKTACGSCSGTQAGERSPCFRCGKSGRVPCSNCSGSGRKKWDCPDPCDNGTITYTWPKRRTVRCTSCQGKGYYEKECASCDGATTVACPDRCQNGAIVKRCTYCTNGRSSEDCPACVGKGTLTSECEVCHGQGRTPVPCKTCRQSKRCQTCAGKGFAKV